MSSYQDTLQQGATIGCYQIEEVLGRGGFAVTYLAIDQNLDVYVAIKEYLPREIINRTADGLVMPRESEFAEDYQTGLENFAREAKTLALFKHPNIVRVHQVLHENNTAYMVMDYEHGRELAEVLEERKGLSEEALRPILFPVLDAVAEIHHQGYVHRDIKPSNIYLRDNGSPVLLDFGAARYTLSETTQQLTAVVTVGYTPIEQYNVSDADQGPWTDIYALSAVLYEAVTGEMPVDSVTRASSTLTDAADPLVPVRNKSLHPCSDAFYDAIDWGLQMDALERPRSISQWVDALNGKMLAAGDTESTIQPAATAGVKPDRPKRASRLRTRAKSLAAAETDSHQRTSVELAMQDFNVEHYPDSRIEPSFGESLTDIDVGDNEQLPAQSAQTNYSPTDHSRTDSADVNSSRGQNRADAGMNAMHRTGNSSPEPTADAHTAARAAPASSPPILTNTSPGTTNLREPGTLPSRSDDSSSRHAAESATALHNTEAPRIQPPSIQPPSIQPPSIQPPSIQAPSTRAPGIEEPSARVPNAGKTHTQEIRDVVRRDIMKRDVDAEPAVTTDTRHVDRRAEDQHQPSHAASEFNTPGNRRPGRILTRVQAAQVPVAAADQPDRTPPGGYQQQPRAFDEPAMITERDDVQFDESDWDYEPPGNGSKWKWLLPATGLAAVFAAAMLYVNKPELFQFNQPHIPELTIDAALEHAQDKIADGEYIFPAGESALDYYQLVLGSDPDNSEALAGVKLIENQVRERIVQSVENNSLSEANRLLSRANQAGLHVDKIPSANGTDTVSSASTDTASSSTTDAPTVTAIDKDLSPFLKQRIAQIEREIEDGNADAADALFAQTDQYLPDPDLSSSLKQRIEALRAETATRSESATPATTISTATTSTATTSNATSEEEIRVSGYSADTGAESDAGGEAPPITNSLGDSSNPYPNAEIPARATQSPSVENSDSTVALAEPATAAEAESINATTGSSSSQRGSSVSSTTPNRVETADKPVSAPRRSYIDGRGASARHLNQLRTAIEAKNLNRVLQVSDNLPSERVDFLKQMFRRYDRLDVVIDRIRDQSGELTANLNVSMFNQRSDGSYYSAGRWNGVTVRSSQVDNQWQKIEW